MKPVTARQIDAILPFLEQFEEAGFSVGTWHNEPGVMSYFNFNEVVLEFQQILYANDWVTPKVDWVEWQDANLECTLLATMPGRMVDLGAYPGLVLDSSMQVHGEFVRLRDMERALTRLDRLEGFHGYGADSLYHRVLTTVDTGDNRFRDAWTYVLADSAKSPSTIPSGNWRKHRGTEETFLTDLFSAHCGDRVTSITNELARRVLFSMRGNYDEVLQSLSPLVERFTDGTVSERRLAQASGVWVCLP